MLREKAPEHAGESAIGDEATCFYHSEKRAEGTCDHCGRFLCSLCMMDLNGSRLCPLCLETGRKKGRLANLDRHRTLYDSVALRLALFPLLLFWFTAITAPIALFLALRHWKSPVSIVGRGRARFVAAIVISGVQILGWIFAVAYLIVVR